MSEKAFAALLKVQFTPTLLFFDEKGAVALRLNGYYPPHQLHAALDYVAGRHEDKTAFADYLKRHAREPASGKLHDQPFFLKPPLDLDRSRRPGQRPLAVLFEQKQCAACDELHQQGLQAIPRRARLDRQIRRGAARVVRDGAAGHAAAASRSRRSSGDASWRSPTRRPSCSSTRTARKRSASRPISGRSTSRPVLDYVASGAYRNEPSFQRYIQARAERIRAGGGRVDLW